MCNYYKTSMTATIHSSKTSTYLTTANLSDGSWRGSQQNFILNFKEQGRIYNDTSVHDKYSDGQLIQFLEQAVSGVPNLSGARRVDMLARSAAKNEDTYSFEDYTTSLLSLAAIYDAAHSANVHDIIEKSRIFEPDHNDKPALEVSSHTLDEKKNKVSSDTDLLHLATHVVQDSTTIPNLLSGNIANVQSQPSSRNVSFSNELRYHELNRSAYQSYSHEMHADDIDDGFKTDSEDDAVSQLYIPEA
ncbi:hypothetical protein SEMRO_2577_G331790.1 [Seminavis robusta]|uniref:Uncharacterized protein n=1 Tax=Seminavis robusta TaxID=568900 RepID=A0A9N8EZF4_9STRA|nr:hypothetical protein SEMRO_2577_G331790.1 [Seminavis robusta]|eukprot:Sro2577_g331790.1 n/a (246) ;mRNA; f:4627-5740